MKSIDELGQVITTDVLVIGGGIAGVIAGIKAKEKPVDVLVVDKGGVGWAGQVPITGAFCVVIRPDEVEEFFKWTVEEGEYLNNQDWTYVYANETYNSIMETADWGVPYYRTPDGEIAHVPFHKHYGGTFYNPGKYMIKLKAVALARGVKVLNKVFIVDLLRQNGKVAGAIGFGVVDGKTYIIKAKATILACGASMAKAHRHFVVNTGEGVAMAYRAGAQLMNAEFGGAGIYGFGFKAGGIRRRMPLYLFYENALGERFMGKYYPELESGLKPGESAREDFHQIADAMAKEVEAGRGPIYINFSKLTPEERAIALIHQKVPLEVQPVGRGGDLLEYLRKRTGIDANKERVEVIPQLYGGFGPVRVGTDCQTTLNGLWAVGDACGLGSSVTGAMHPAAFPGVNAIGGAIVTGLRAGRSVGEYAEVSDQAQVEYGVVKKLEERLLAPLGRDATVGVHEVVYLVQEAVVPVKYYLHREGGRLTQSLGIIDTAKQKLLGAGAKDHHELMQYHRAESMALCAGWSLKAALMREESRGSHRRDDFPNRDDKNWLKWIVIEQKEGEERFLTEPVPLENYRLRSPGK